MTNPDLSAIPASTMIDELVRRLGEENAAWQLGLSNIAELRALAEKLDG